MIRVSVLGQAFLFMISFLLSGSFAWVTGPGGDGSSQSFFGLGDKKLDIPVNHQPRLTLNNITTIAIQEFEEAQGVRGQYAAELTDRITAAIATSSKFEVVDRTHLDALMKEKHLQYKGTVDERTAVELNKMLGAALYLTGRITRFALPTTHVTSTRYKDFLGNWHTKYQRRTNATLVATMEIIDVTTHKKYAPAQVDGSVEIVTEAEDGQPEELDKNRVLSVAYTKTVALLTRSILPWQETVALTVYQDEDKSYDLKMSFKQIEAGQYQEAIQTLKTAIKANGGDNPIDKKKITPISKALHNLGIALMSAGNPDAALIELQKSRVLKDNDNIKNSIVACNKMIQLNNEAPILETKLPSSEPAPQPPRPTGEPPKPPEPKKSTAGEEEVLTNAFIISLVKKNTGEKLILQLISESKCSFKMMPSAILELKDAGVSDTVIDAMKSRMKVGK